MSTSKSRLPLIGVTMGDPQGIGPEVVQKAVSSSALRKICRIAVFGDAIYYDWKKSASLSPRQCGELSGFYIQQGIHAALTGQIDALVTAPISKERLQAGGYDFPGHTEFLATASGTKEVRMMMAGPTLRIALATLHEPFRKISSLLSIPSLVQTIEITNDFMKHRLKIKKPRIAVAGLNPHAGEAGIFGSEEKEKILPAVQRARKKKILVTGPYSPDTVFYRAAHEEFDVVVALYHDQGLIPLKLLHFDTAVNITMGIPFVRTSVDHGTAFDIAGKGIASASSMMAAIKMAVELIK